MTKTNKCYWYERSAVRILPNAEVLMVKTVPAELPAFKGEDGYFHFYLQGEIPLYLDKQQQINLYWRLNKNEGATVNKKELEFILTNNS